MRFIDPDGMAPRSVSTVQGSPAHSDSEESTQNEVATGRAGPEREDVLVDVGYGTVSSGMLTMGVDYAGDFRNAKKGAQEDNDCCGDKSKELESLHIKTDIEPYGGTPPFLPGGVGGWSNIKNFWSVLKNVRSLFNAAKTGFSVNPSKFDYFFGRVVSGSGHNIARSAQNLKDLTTLGIKSESQLMKVFGQALESGTVISTKTSQYGTTVMRSVNIGNKGSVNVGFFYQGGNMSATPSVSTIIPKIFK